MAQNLDITPPTSHQRRGDDSLKQGCTTHGHIRPSQIVKKYKKLLVKDSNFKNLNSIELVTILQLTTIESSSDVGHILLNGNNIKRWFWSAGPMIAKAGVWAIEDLARGTRRLWRSSERGWQREMPEEGKRIRSRRLNTWEFDRERLFQNVRTLSRIRVREVNKIVYARCRETSV